MKNLMPVFGAGLAFLHEVVHGAADRSYGIQVAKLAGVPASSVFSPLTIDS